MIITLSRPASFLAQLVYGEGSKQPYFHQAYGYSVGLHFVYSGSGGAGDGAHGDDYVLGVFAFVSFDQAVGSSGEFFPFFVGVFGDGEDFIHGLGELFTVPVVEFLADYVAK